MNEPVFETKEDKKKGNYARFVISPLEQGYGYTLGNSLRRVLLTNLPGAAITSVKISGVKHQFQVLKGMREDIIEFVLNLKKVNFSLADSVDAKGSKKPIKATLSAKGPGEVKAKDIKVDSTVKIANPEIVLAHLSKGAKIEATMQIESGVGYIPADERDEKKEVGLIWLDASFSPVLRVNYKVEETRVGRLTNYDKLIMDIWTDGTLAAKDALAAGSKILVAYFNQIVSPKRVKKLDKATEKDSLGPVGKLSVEEISLPTRVANALVKAGYDTVEDLVKAKREDLVKVRNLGGKSVKIINAALGEKDVKLTE